MLIRKILAILLIAAALLSGCGAAAPAGNRAELQRKSVFATEAPRPAEAPAAPGQPYPEASGGVTANDGLRQAVGQPAQTDRLVIRNAQLSVVVVDPSESLDTLQKMAVELGGYVVAANLSEASLNDGSKVPVANLTIRVPAAKLDEALKRIRAESDRLPLNEQITSQDVTSDYVDLGARLKNLEAAEAQLAKIMEQAAKTEDVLKVFDELTRVRGEIESIKGKMKYYEQSAALSSISVDLKAKDSIKPITIVGWEPVGVARDALQALIEGLQSVINALIWLGIYILPTLVILFLIFVLPFILIIRWLFRRSRRAKAAREALPPAPPQA
jgi:hypothetical protein